MYGHEYSAIPNRSEIVMKKSKQCLINFLLILDGTVSHASMSKDKGCTLRENGWPTLSTKTNFHRQKTLTAKNRLAFLCLCYDFLLEFHLSSKLD